MRECFKPKPLLPQPLALAGLLSWVAVLLAMREEAGELTPTRLGVLLAFLLVFLFNCPPRIGPRLRNTLLWLQLALALLLMVLAPHNDMPPVLLVMVAMQSASTWRPLHAVLALGLANLIFMLVLIQAGHAAPWVLVMVYVSFQGFAGLLGYYAHNAETARDRLAMVNAEILATRSLLADSARDTERLRVARELHDVAGHKLTALKLNLRALAADPGLAQHPQIKLGQQLASELLEDIRGVVQALRDSRGLDLQTALRALAAPLPHLRMQLSIDRGTVIHDPHLAETVLRVVQEAMTNAARHANASVLWVTLQHQDGHVMLSITDNGQAPATLREGNGLAGIRERVANVDGQLHITRDVAGNLKLSVVFPI